MENVPWASETAVPTTLPWSSSTVIFTPGTGFGGLTRASIIVPLMWIVSSAAAGAEAAA